MSDTPRTDAMFRAYVSDPNDNGDYILSLNKQETEELFRRVGELERENAKLREALSARDKPVAYTPQNNAQMTCATCGKVLTNGRWFGTLHLCS